MWLLLMLVAGPVVFGAYSWYRHVFERDCLAMLREEQAAVLREEHARAAGEARVLQLSGGRDRRS